MPTEQKSGSSHGDKDHLWVVQLSAIARITASCLSEEGGLSITDDELAKKIVDGIKKELGGQKLYVPETLSRMRKIYEVAKENQLPPTSGEIKSFFHSKTKVNPDAVYGCGRKIAALKQTLFGFDVSSIEIEIVNIAMGVVETER